MTTIKFIAVNDARITSQVEGCGLGFPHIGIRLVAEQMGYGTVGTGYGFTLVYSGTLKGWDGERPELLGWLVSVDA